MDWITVFHEALPYAAFLDRYANPTHRPRWDAAHARIRLNPHQAELLGGSQGNAGRLPDRGLVRRLHQPVPGVRSLPRASSAIDLRFLDRDARPDMPRRPGDQRRAPRARGRLPERGRLRGRSLRRADPLGLPQARRRPLGPACPTGLVPPSDDLIAQGAAEWLGEFERAQLILRLSPRLRQKHGD